MCFCIKSNFECYLFFTGSNHCRKCWLLRGCNGIHSNVCGCGGSVWDTSAYHRRGGVLWMCIISEFSVEANCSTWRQSPKGSAKLDTTRKDLVWVMIVSLFWHNWCQFSSAQKVCPFYRFHISIICTLFSQVISRNMAINTQSHVER